MLGVAKDANSLEIREAYLKKAKEYHPDKRPENLDYFTKIQQAHEILIDDHKRAIYDEEAISDEEFFTINIGGMKVNMFTVFMLACTGCFGLAGYKYFYAGSQEGACPVDHKARHEMVSAGKTRKANE